MPIDADFLRAKEKVKRGIEYRDTVDIDFGDEELTFGFRLLTESEYDLVEREMPFDELSDEDTDTLDEDEQERLEELYEKANEDPDSLSDEEVEELDDLASRSGVRQLLETLDADANAALREAGRKALYPNPEDVQEVLDAEFSEQVEVLGPETVEGTLTESKVEEAIKEDLEDLVKEQPFPVQRAVGLRAYMETRKVRGNGIRAA